MKKFNISDYLKSSILSSLILKFRLTWEKVIVFLTNNGKVGRESQNIQNYSRKYSDLMKWEEQMLKDVGLKIPPKTKHNVSNSVNSDFEITFIRRKSESHEVKSGKDEIKKR